jgi:hypothetical protein
LNAEPEYLAGMAAVWIARVKVSHGIAHVGGILRYTG